MLLLGEHLSVKFSAEIKFCKIGPLLAVKAAPKAHADDTMM
jgi:hypothetical protein